MSAAGSAAVEGSSGAGAADLDADASSKAAASEIAEEAGAAGTAVAAQGPSPAASGGDDVQVEQPESIPMQGELVISELMIDPKALRDSEGEWIELYNAAARELSLRGCEIGDGGPQLHKITKDIRMPPGGYATLARSTAAGFEPDALVPIALTNRADSVSVRCDGREIDVVSFDKARGFPVSAGKSMALSGTALSASANDVAAAWCVSKDKHGVELGTPGQPNQACDAAADGSRAEQMQTEPARDIMP